MDCYVFKIYLIDVFMTVYHDVPVTCIVTQSEKISKNSLFSKVKVAIVLIRNFMCTTVFCKFCVYFIIVDLIVKSLKIGHQILIISTNLK